MDTSAGAAVIQIDVEQLPQASLDVIAQVDARLTRFPVRLYTVDFMFDPSGRPFVTELNSRPGVPSASKVGAARADRFHQALAAIFKQLA